MKICTEKTIIIDGDFIPYTASGIYQYNNISEWDALQIVDTIIDTITSNSTCKRYLIVVSSPKPDFRKKEYPHYKQNRENQEKPTLFLQAKDYFFSKYNPLIVENVEADDVCCSFHTQYDDTILCSPDKDLLQCPGYHYNIKTKEIIYIDDIGELKLIQKAKKKKLYSSGQYKIWHQMISGDSVDNIKGLPRYGDVKSYNLLSKCKNPEQMRRVVVDEYYSVYQDEYRARFEETYCLVKMRDDLSLPDLNSISTNIY